MLVAVISWRPRRRPAPAPRLPPSVEISGSLRRIESTPRGSFRQDEQDEQDDLLREVQEAFNIASGVSSLLILLILSEKLRSSSVQPEWIPLTGTDASFGFLLRRKRALAEEYWAGGVFFWWAGVFVLDPEASTLHTRTMPALPLNQGRMWCRHEYSGTGVSPVRRNSWRRFQLCLTGETPVPLDPAWS